MMTIADLHIHSRFSMATARDTDPEHLWAWAQRKGLDLVGTGDLTHPAWLEELETKLVETGDGAYALRPELAASVGELVPAACGRPVRFVLSGEISCIYKKDGRTRKIHCLVLLPDFAAARRLNQRLDRLGNIRSDGRPILGLDARDLLEVVLQASDQAIFIPAHIWTPWFSLFGSKSGFDRLEDCFGDLSRHIFALETGLSSDPPMNRRLSALDRFALVSNSDAHSPAKLAREANLLEAPATYPDLRHALMHPGPGGLVGTLEFFPDEGKYHLDGHRKCGVRLDPAETRRLGGVCPVCGGPLTVGVLSRVEDLADRDEPAAPGAGGIFESLAPLDEVVAEVVQKNPGTKAVRSLLERLLAEQGPELHVLRQAPLEDLERLGGPVLAEGMRRLRAGQVILEGGYDGEFGKVALFDAAERRQLAGQKAMWSLAAPRKTKPAPAPPVAAAPAAAPPLVALAAARSEALNEAQERAVAHEGGHLIVCAGPGAGKTRVLAHRAARLVERGLDPARLLMITFTRKAAAEMATRLAEGPAAAAPARTFHALGREILSRARGAEPAILDGDAREALVARLAKAHGLSKGAADLGLTRLKQSLEAEPAAELAPVWADYQAALADQGALDLDDLVREAALTLLGDPDQAAHWAGRFDQVLVDEYQDTNPVQVALLKLLAAGGAHVAAIGDPDQAIYGFRGADPGAFARFADDFPGAARVELATNYRNSPQILAAALGVLGRGPAPGQAQAPDAPRPQLAGLAGPQAEAAWIAARVVELIGGADSRQTERQGADGEFAPREIAVLYRLHALAAPIEAALRQARVPVQTAVPDPLAELDPLDFRAQRVSLISLHAAKGLEFPVVFIAGCEEGLLPYEPPSGDPADPDEERRLLFVGMTRARRRLFLTHGRERSLFGRRRQPQLSPFLTQAAPGLWEMASGRGRARGHHQLGLFS